MGHEQYWKHTFELCPGDLLVGVDRACGVVLGNWLLHDNTHDVLVVWSGSVKATGLTQQRFARYKATPMMKWYTFESRQATDTRSEGLF